MIRKALLCLGAVAAALAAGSPDAIAKDQPVPAKEKECAEAPEKCEAPPMALDVPQTLPAADGVYDTSEVAAQRFDLENKVVKLRFYNAKDAKQLGPDVMAAHLFDRNWNCVYVHFPKAAH